MMVQNYLSLDHKVYEYGLSSAYDISSASLTQDFSIGARGVSARYGIQYRWNHDVCYWPRGRCK